MGGVIWRADSILFLMYETPPHPLPKTVHKKKRTVHYSTDCGTAGGATPGSHIGPARCMCGSGVSGATCAWCVGGMAARFTRGGDAPQCQAPRRRAIRGPGAVGRPVALKHYLAAPRPGFQNGVRSSAIRYPCAMMPREPIVLSAATAMRRTLHEQSW